MHTSLPRVLALSGILACTGCGSQAAAPHDSALAGNESTAGSRVEDGTGLRTASSSSGARVTLALPAGPLHPGAVTFTVRVDRVGTAVRPQSVDLVSPTMPIHGIVRTPLAPSADSEYVGRLEVPMEGTWALYVNFDEVGGDAAEFVFDVEPPADSASALGRADHVGHGSQVEHGGHSHGAASDDPGTHPGGAPGVSAVSPTKGG